MEGMMRRPDPGQRTWFRDKPECVIGLPSWALSPGQVEAYRATPGMAVVEIAGRDSVAAAVKAVEDEGFTDLLPTYAYTGTEYGAWSTVLNAVMRLGERLPQIRVHPPLVIGSPRFWQALNGRFITTLIHTYGFFSPCIGCHLYLHSVRIPLSVSLGGVPVIAGEREGHDGVRKINQIGEALSRYEALGSEFGVRLLFPLRHISSGSEIQDILRMAWEEGEDQLKCVLSGNYQGVDRTVAVTEAQVVAYLETFACPATRAILRSYLEGEVPDHLRIAAEILKPRGCH